MDISGDFPRFPSASRAAQANTARCLGHTGVSFAESPFFQLISSITASNGEIEREKETERERERKRERALDGDSRLSAARNKSQLSPDNLIRFNLPVDSIPPLFFNARKREREKRTRTHAGANIIYTAAGGVDGGVRFPFRRAFGPRRVNRRVALAQSNNSISSLARSGRRFVVLARRRCPICSPRLPAAPRAGPSLPPPPRNRAANGTREDCEWTATILFDKETASLCASAASAGRSVRRFD